MESEGASIPMTFSADDDVSDKDISVEMEVLKLCPLFTVVGLVDTQILMLGKSDGAEELAALRRV